jgi:hypothetical protein
MQNKVRESVGVLFEMLELRSIQTADQSPFIYALPPQGTIAGRKNAAMQL